MASVSCLPRNPAPGSVSRLLPGLRARADGPDLAPRRLPRLRQRREPLLLRRRPEGRAARRRASTFPARWKVSIALPRAGRRLPRGRLRRARRLAVRVRHAPDLRVPRCTASRTRSRSGAAATRTPRRLVRDLTALVKEAAALFGGLPYERYVFLVHLAAGRTRRARAPRLAVGRRSTRSRSGRRRRTATSSCSSRTSSSTPGTSSGSGPGRSARSTTRERSTRGTSGRWRGSPRTTRSSSSSARASQEPKHLRGDGRRLWKAHRDTPGTAVQSAEIASFDAWIRFYRPDENSPNVSESYYRRGDADRLALDLTIRQATRGRGRSTTSCGASSVGGERRGSPTRTARWRRRRRAVAGADLRAASSTGTSGASGRRHSSASSRRSAWTLREKPEREPTARRRRRSATRGRLRLEDEGGERAPRRRGGPGPDARPTRRGSRRATSSSPSTGVKASEDELQRLVRDGKSGTRVEVTVFRRGRLLTIPLTLGARRAFAYEIVLDENAARDARRLGRGWLGPALG